MKPKVASLANPIVVKTTARSDATDLIVIIFSDVLDLDFNDGIFVIYNESISCLGYGESDV